MNKFIVILFAFFVGSSHASWQFIDKHPDYELYINSNTLTKTAQGYRFTWIYSYTKPIRLGTRKTGYYDALSFGYDEEINCSTKEVRLFSSSPYSNTMGRGLIKTNTMNPQWMSVYHKNKGEGIQKIFAKICR